MKTVLVCNTCYEKEGRSSAHCTFTNTFFNSKATALLLTCPFSGNKCDWKIKVIKTKRSKNA